MRAEYAERVRVAASDRTHHRDSPEAIVQADETRKNVWAAIERLSYEHREIIVLRHFEDLAYEEIAELLGIPVGSVMSRLYYARKKLRELLGDRYER